MAIATERQASVSVEIGGREITFESGKLAKQADGAVVIRSGETMVLATAHQALPLLALMLFLLLCCVLLWARLPLTGALVRLVAFG